MASGKVAMGCVGQGIEEVIQHGENGWLVPPNGLEELIEGLRVVVRNDLLRRQIGAAARDTVLRSFTLAQQAHRLLTVYRESLA
jgi:glycosyltransferase involved in cell wall biosynthesis